MKRALSFGRVGSALVKPLGPMFQWEDWALTKSSEDYERAHTGLRPNPGRGGGGEAAANVPKGGYRGTFV